MTAAIVLAVSGALAQAAENLVKNGDAETGALDNWDGFAGVFSDGAHGGKHCFLIKTVVGPGTHCFSKELIPIDPAKAYKLSGWFRSIGNAKSRIHLGYTPYDAKKEVIAPWNAACWPNSETVLAADCNADDTVVKIANGAAWGTYGGSVIAFDVDDSGKFADLPNRHISSLGIMKVVNKGQCWEVNLRSKCGRTYPAGTKVREHGSGNTHLFNAAGAEVVPTEWTQYSGTIRESAKSTMVNDQWAPGTAYVRIVIFSNLGQDNAEELQVLADDIVMTEDPGWTLQFSDDFNRSELNAGAAQAAAPDWQVVNGKWRIENGMLRGESAADIVLLRHIPGDQRLEFDAVAQPDNICDLTGILGTNERGGYAEGYFFGFGSENNTSSKLLRKDREVNRCDERIVPGKLHHIVCQRSGNVLTHIVDGKVILTYDDAQPLIGPGHDMVGLYIYGAGSIDNVKVYTKGPGAK